ncbi:MAG TPA: hypothetical protein VNT03_08440 [Baekduia sp.]|nr:hypothetical protein [Baekduia sp.]
MRRSTLMILVSLLVVFGTTTAYAWFSTSGTGSAQASTGTFSAPAIQTATPGAGTVALTWSSVAPPAGGTVTYHVTRDGGAAAGNCATATAPTTATSCTDSGVSAGSHSYTVTSVWRSWTATSTTTAVTVASGAATRLVLAAATTTPAAGAADDLTITAKDAQNNTVSAYSGDKSLTFGGASSAPDGTRPTVSDTTSVAKDFGATTTTTFTSGVATVSGSSNGVMRLYRAGPATVTVSDGSIGDNLSVTVTPASAALLSVSGYPTPTVAGSSHAFTVTARDAFGNTATGYTGTVGFSASNDAQAVLPSNATLTSGTGSFNATFKTVAGAAKTLTATDTATSSITGNQPGITVTPAAAATTIVTSGSGQSAPVSTGFALPLVASVSDAFGNPLAGVAVTFAGPLSGAGGTFASSGCTSNTPTSQCVVTTAANGRATSSTLTANATAGAYSVSASASGTNTAGFSLTNLLDTFQVSVPGTQTAGTPFTATITARLGAATDTGYTGTKCLVFSGPASSPSNTAPAYPVGGSPCAAGESRLTFTSGVATATVTLFRATASATLTATQSAITGTSAGFAVNSAGVVLSYNRSCPVAVARGSTTAFTINVPTDAWANPFTNQTSVGVALTLSPSSNFVFGTVGTGTTTVNLTTGLATNTFSVDENGANKTTTLTATAPTGFTAPANCTINAGS